MLHRSWKVNVQDEHLFILGSNKNIKNYESCLKDAGASLMGLPLGKSETLQHQKE